MSTTLMVAVGGDGRALPFIQPVANSVTGSPFSVDDDPAVTSDPIVAEAVMISPSEPVHVRVSASGAAADTNDLLLVAGYHVMPWRTGDRLSMITPTGASVVYVERARRSDEEV